MEASRNVMTVQPLIAAICSLDRLIVVTLNA